MRAIPRNLLWPFFVVGSAFAFAYGFEAGWGALTLTIVPTIAVTTLLMLELVFPADPERYAYRDPQLFHDIGHSVIGQIFGNELGRILFLTGAAAIAGWISETWGGNLWPTHWPFWIQAIALIFVADALDYGRHRSQHMIPWLWPIHSLHHNTDQLNVLKSGRTHLLDMAFRSLVVYAPLVAVGVPAEVLYWYRGRDDLRTMDIGHSNLDISLPSWVHCVVLTPHEHRIHHAGDLRLGNSNFANVFPVLDILGGTFEHPDRHPTPEFGNPDDPTPTSFTGQLLAPFIWNKLERTTPYST